MRVNPNNDFGAKIIFNDVDISHICTYADDDLGMVKVALSASKGGCLVKNEDIFTVAVFGKVRIIKPNNA